MESKTRSPAQDEIKIVVSSFEADQVEVATFENTPAENSLSALGVVPVRLRIVDRELALAGF